MLDFNLKIGGEAGQGLVTIGNTLTKAFARGGLYVFSDMDYESRVRGGHNFTRIRVRDVPTFAISDELDLLVALDRRSIDEHIEELKECGVVIYDGETLGMELEGETNLNIPLTRLAVEEGGHKIMTNTVAAGAVLGIIGYDFDILIDLLKGAFKKKGNEIIESNVKAARAGYDYARENLKGCFNINIKPTGDKPKMLINGSDAMGMGAVFAGCKFLAAYPMTPSTGVMNYLAGKAKDFDLVVEQVEDEIAAINMTIGASYAGVRAMTTTSGGGFCLMTEGLALAGITETPIVCVDAMRPGPATGLPTRTEQGDLKFMIHAAHGEFPRAILAPGNVEQAFFAMPLAFNLAEKYQTPVIVLSDQYLADCLVTVDRFDTSGIVIDRGKLLTEEEVDADDYQRYKLTDDGVSPRAMPSIGGALVVIDSDEHTEEGHITESGDVRNHMMDKRLKKMEGLKKNMIVPKVYGDSEGIMLIGWGSTLGALTEAVDILRERGVKAGMLHIENVWPLPKEAISSVIESAKRVFVVENNATGQLASIIRAETGLETEGVLKYDGRPFSPREIVDTIKGMGGF